MRLWVKALLFYGVFFCGFFISTFFIPQKVAAVVFPFWVIVFGAASLVFFRCPACGQSAFTSPSSMWRRLWTGMKCRHCGKEY